MSTNEPTSAAVDIDGTCAHLAQTSVEFALLFGSHARETASDDSDVDVALRFPEEMDAYERFRRRNRIDAKLQEYAESFVDVSDIATLPISVAYTALRDGILLVGEESDVTAIESRSNRSTKPRKTNESKHDENSSIDSPEETYRWRDSRC